MRRSPQCLERKAEYGDVLRSAMQEAGVGVRGLSKRATLSRELIQSIMNGRIEPTVQVWSKLCEALGVKQ